MNVDPVPFIADALFFHPTPHMDERGFFCCTFNPDVMRAAGIDSAAFPQDSLSYSSRGVEFGLHVRRGDGEARLLRCSYGAIFDVIVDLRRQPRRHTGTERASGSVIASRSHFTFRPAARTDFRPFPTRRTCLIALTGLTTLLRTCRSHSMILS